MKRRLLLSCVSCLLALGLVTACNNEEDVDLNGDDGTTQNDGGGSDGTTQGGGSGDTSGSGENTGDENTGGGYTAGEGETGVTLTNLTVRFYFKTEEVYHTLPTFTDAGDGSQTSSTDAYITGYFNGCDNAWVDYAVDATTPVGKLTAGTDESSNPYYSYTFTSVAEGCDFNIYLEHNDAEAATWANKVFSSDAQLLFEETPADGATVDYIIEVDPADVIHSPFVHCKVTIGVFITDASYSATSTLYIGGNFTPVNGGSWGVATLTTSSNVESDGYHYYYEATVTQGESELDFYISTNSNPWNGRLLVDDNTKYWDDDLNAGWFNYGSSDGIGISAGLTECEEFTFIIATAASTLGDTSSSSNTITGGCVAYMDGELVAASGCYASTVEDE